MIQQVAIERATLEPIRSWMKPNNNGYNTRIVNPERARLTRAAYLSLQSTHIIMITFISGSNDSPADLTLLGSAPAKAFLLIIASLFAPRHSSIVVDHLAPQSESAHNLWQTWCRIGKLELFITVRSWPRSQRASLAARAGATIEVCRAAFQLCAGCRLVNLVANFQQSRLNFSSPRSTKSSTLLSMHTSN